MSGTSDASTTDVDPSPNDATTAPPLSALFLIIFDQKVGYTIAWKRSAVNVPLDGAVEFKSLPSGLHTVKHDLVYFVHQGYAGLSAFVNGPASESERNAHLVSVGILVPLSYGRLGRSWLHAQSLQDLAAVLVDDASKTDPLEQFWEQHRVDHTPDSQSPKLPVQSSGSEPPSSKLKAHRRSRTLSSVTAVLPSEQSLPPSHPALSIIKYIDTFGPLLFPLQRAALLRKRILFIAPPPVRLTCEFVYDLSILSSIPASVYDILPPGSESLHRLRSFFALGIHDIPLLEKESTAPQSRETAHDEGEDSAKGWVACTTDEILGIKKKLYDIIVELPPTYEHAPRERRWPTVKTSKGTELKASQRDLIRYKLLHQQLWKIGHRPHARDIEPEEEETTDDTTTLLPHDDGTKDSDESDDGLDDKVVEPMSWSQLAYSGFMWWASAGENDAYLSEETDRDRKLLGDLSDFVPGGLIPAEGGAAADPMSTSGVARAGLHAAIIAYFHRLTALMLTAMADLIEAADEEEDATVGGEEDGVLVVRRDDVTRMGLDAWSEVDKAFTRECLGLYFGREADVYGPSLECCGMRIC